LVSSIINATVCKLLLWYGVTGSYTEEPDTNGGEWVL
jgi:hypothetical protein